MIDVWTDGSCSAVDRVGGWAAIIKNQHNAFFNQTIGGFEIDTTSQRMELTAPLRALTHYDVPSRITIHSDSAYLVNCILQKWIVGWRERNWMSSKNTPVKNRDLWEALHAAIEFHKQVDFVKVKGHSDDVFNEEADQAANRYREAGLASISTGK